jgi:hypothetical protein
MVSQASVGGSPSAFFFCYNLKSVYFVIASRCFRIGKPPSSHSMSCTEEEVSWDRLTVLKALLKTEQKGNLEVLVDSGSYRVVWTEVVCSDLCCMCRTRKCTTTPSRETNVFVDHSVYVCDTASTVRWSNFDRRDPKMGVFLGSTEATTCGHLLNESLPPKTPCGHHVYGRHGHGSSVKNR